MPDRFAFRRPKQCPNCGPEAAPHIHLEQTIKGSLSHIWWQCAKCELNWPINPPEQGERRMGERRLGRKNAFQRKTGAPRSPE